MARRVCEARIEGGFAEVARIASASTFSEATLEAVRSADDSLIHG